MKPKRKQLTVASAEAAELHGDLFSAVTHELGAISTALELRAEALASVLSRADQTALIALSAELADIKRALRIVQGSRGNTTSLSPERRTPSTDWWHTITRLVSATLSRGVTCKLAASDAFLTPNQSNGLTLMWLAACKDVSESELMSPTSIDISIRSHVVDDAGVTGGLTMTAEFESSAPASYGQTRRPTRWFRYATKLARAHNAELTWWTRDGSAVRWRCDLSGNSTNA